MSEEKPIPFKKFLTLFPQKAAPSELAPATGSAISEEMLNKMDACRYLLPEPGAEVAGQLIAEIRRLREVLSWIAGQQNLFFAECSQAEEIVAKCKEALSPNIKPEP